MSATLHVVGVKDITDDYKKKLDAYIACDAAGVPLPKELVDFFGSIRPELVPKDGIEIDLLDHTCNHACVTKGAGYHNYIVDVAKLPPGVTRVRIYTT